jgi:hypothetical protein
MKMAKADCSHKISSAKVKPKICFFFATLVLAFNDLGNKAALLLKWGCSFEAKLFGVRQAIP